MKAILMSIQAKHLVNILNGKKTKEIRKSIPKGFVGWVYLYCTKAKPYLINKDMISEFFEMRNDYEETYIGEVLNGKVVARFWFDEYDGYDDIIYIENEYVWCHGITLSNGLVDLFYLNKLKLSHEQMLDYGKGKDLYAWHIKNLEIFDKPKELREFYKWVRKTIYSGMDCPPYVDDVLVQLTRAPQSWQYVEVVE